MYGYSDGTTSYWICEAVFTAGMIVFFGLGLWRKWRWTAWAYPAGQLLIRAALLIFQPTDFALEPMLEPTALMIALCVLSPLMIRYSWVGWLTAVLSVWLICLTAPEGFGDLGLYFSFGHELTWLGLQVIFSALALGLLTVMGVLMARGWFDSQKTVEQ
jgi:hypothetical protein